MDGISLLVFQLIILLFSVMVHEVSHGYVAEHLGDPTARLAGRLNFNPLRHLDPFGSFLLPLILGIPALFGQPTFIFGYAKPVPYNPQNLRNPEKGAALIAAAGPASNLVIAALFGLFIRTAILFQIGGGLLISLLTIVVSLNLLLAFFNLLPIPPIDGSKILAFLLPPRLRARWYHAWHRIGMLIRSNLLIFLLLLFFSFRYIFAIIFLVISPFINFFHILFAGFPSPFF